MTTFEDHQRPNATAAFRAQFNTAPDAEVDGEHCFEDRNRLVLKIRATGRVAVNFPGPTRFVSEANMLASLDRMAGSDAAWRRADPLNEQAFDEVFNDDEYKSDERERFLSASWSIEDAEDGYRHELPCLHRTLASGSPHTPVALDAAARSSYAKLVHGLPQDASDFLAPVELGRRRRPDLRGLRP